MTKVTKLITIPYIALVSLSVLFGLIWFVNPFRVSGKLAVLDSKHLSNGQLILLTQRYNASLGEPSTITIYQMVSSNQWRRYYLDHEASYWWSGKLEDIDENSFWILRGKQRIAKLDLLKSELFLTAHTQAAYKAHPVDKSPLENPYVRPQDASVQPNDDCL